ncbi:MAG: hypothetical protein JWQ18_2745 [Conexibacter sp.]|nr:hypothetical protein [Conexibacter sp.]
MSLLFTLALGYVLWTVGIDAANAACFLLVGTTAEVLALLTVVLVVIWLAAGIVLRLGGIGVAAVGLLFALLRHPIGLLIAPLGGVLWAAGHWHYALRHHTYKSPLARRLFIDLLPDWADPTRGWSISTTTTTDHD